MSFAALFAVIARESLSPGIMGLSISYALQVNTVTCICVNCFRSYPFQRQQEVISILYNRGFVLILLYAVFAQWTVDYLSDLASKDVLRYGDQHRGGGESERVQRYRERGRETNLTKQRQLESFAWHQQEIEINNVSCHT